MAAIFFLSLRARSAKSSGSNPYARINLAAAAQDLRSPSAKSVHLPVVASNRFTCPNRNEAAHEEESTEYHATRDVMFHVVHPNPWNTLLPLAILKHRTIHGMISFHRRMYGTMPPSAMYG